MFMILVARCLERIAGNTIDIAEQTVFVVTGLFREFVNDRSPHRKPRLLTTESDVLASAGFCKIAQRSRHSLGPHPAASLWATNNILP